MALKSAINGVTERKRRRVVITGIGAVTPVGNTATATWAALVAGQSGITAVTQFDATPYDSQVAGEIKGFNPEPRIPRKEVRRMARCSQISVVAAYEAVEDAGLDFKMEDPTRMGVILGTGVGGQDMFIDMIKSSVTTGKDAQPPCRRDQWPAQHGSLPRQQHLRLSRAAEHGGDGLRGRHPGHRRGHRGDPPRRSRRDAGGRHRSHDLGGVLCHLRGHAGRHDPERRPAARQPALRRQPRRLCHRRGHGDLRAGEPGARPGARRAHLRRGAGMGRIGRRLPYRRARPGGQGCRAVHAQRAGRRRHQPGRGELHQRPRGRHPAGRRPRDQGHQRCLRPTRL